jgi:hypothetical protein
MEAATKTVLTINDFIDDAAETLENMGISSRNNYLVKRPLVLILELTQSKSMQTSTLTTLPLLV